MTLEQLAAARLEAIAKLEADLSGEIDAAQRELYERLLAQLKDIQADPGLLPAILEAYRVQVLAPLALSYGQALLHLPGLNAEYFGKLDVAGYQALRAPLTDFLAQRLGLDAQGVPTQSGYLAALAADTTVTRQVLTFAYQQQFSSIGLLAYKDKLKQLVVGGDAAGLVQELYRNAGDEFAQTDRALQSIAGRELGLSAFLYQGGLIDSSRSFCKVRNGKVFTDFEIARFGTAADAYGGYSNKSQGLFSGKPDPYDPMINCGGYSCRHHWHGVPAVVALRMRPDLAEDKKGQLYIKT